MYDGDIQMTKKNRINIRKFFLFIYLFTEATTTEPEVTKPSC